MMDLHTPGATSAYGTTSVSSQFSVHALNLSRQTDQQESAAKLMTLHLNHSVAVKGVDTRSVSANLFGQVTQGESESLDTAQDGFAHDASETSSLTSRQHGTMPITGKQEQSKHDGDTAEYFGPLLSGISVLDGSEIASRQGVMVSTEAQENMRAMPDDTQGRLNLVDDIEKVVTDLIDSVTKTIGKAVSKVVDGMVDDIGDIVKDITKGIFDEIGDVADDIFGGFFN